MSAANRTSGGAHAHPEPTDERTVGSDCPGPEFRVIVCGGRDFSNAQAVQAALDAAARKHPGLRIVHGGAPGADTLAAAWAERAGCPATAFPADWRAHGRAAGPIRNRAMLDAGADAVIAFPGGRGTANMTKQARAAGVPVWEVKP